MNFSVSLHVKALSPEHQETYQAVEKPPAITVAAYTPPLLGNVYKTA